MPVSNPFAPSQVDPAVNGLRLTLESGVAVSSTDQLAKTTLYMTPYFSGAICLYIAGAWTLKITAEISVALGTLSSGKNYDVFAYWTGSAVAIELLAWTNDSTRATALITQDGVCVKTGATDRRYVGTIRTATATTVEDSAAKRFVWNGPEPWRQVLRHLVSPAETTDTWVYATATWRQANANTANKVEVVVGLATTVRSDVGGGGAGTGGQFSVGVGIDSTSANSAQTITAGYASTGDNSRTTSAQFVGILAPGYHTIVWLELGASGLSFYGDAGGVFSLSGLTAQVPG